MRLTSTLGIGTSSPQSNYISGTTPTITIGDGDAEDTKLFLMEMLKIIMLV